MRVTKTHDIRLIPRDSRGNPLSIPQIRELQARGLYPRFNMPTPTLRKNDDNLIDYELLKKYEV